jgi:deazaflavin-dependent oxidoreductase (nitroreductase family)
MDQTPSSLVYWPFLKLHGAIYRATGGRIGRRMAGTPSLLLTTTGRKSGLPRTCALTYLKDGEAWVVVASNGGSDTPPAWLGNLKANPNVTVQDGRRTFPATARVAEGADRERLWPLVNRNNRGLAPVLHRGTSGRYDAYQRRTEREIAVVVIEPATA